MKATQLFGIGISSKGCSYWVLAPVLFVLGCTVSNSEAEPKVYDTGVELDSQAHDTGVETDRQFNNSVAPAECAADAEPVNIDGMTEIGAVKDWMNILEGGIKAEVFWKSSPTSAQNRTQATFTFDEVKDAVYLFSFSENEDENCSDESSFFLFETQFNFISADGTFDENINCQVQLYGDPEADKAHFIIRGRIDVSELSGSVDVGYFSDFYENPHLGITFVINNDNEIGANLEYKVKYLSGVIGPEEAERYIDTDTTDSDTIVPFAAHSLPTEVLTLSPED